MAINKIMVLGAGTMGMGIAQVFAEAGKTVIVRDIAEAFIQRGEGVLTKNMEKKVAKGKMTAEEKDAVLGRVSYTLELAKAADCDLVVEAAIEVLDVKKSIFKELDELCKPETILASNTSSISITAIASATKRPEKVLGMHFFNPAPAMKLVEVIRGIRTDDETFKAVYDCAAEIGKNPVEVGEAPHPVPDDQRGHHRPRERHRLQGGHRRRHDVRRQPQDGPPRSGRPRWSGHLPGHHGDHLHRDRRQQVSSRSDHEEDGPRRSARP